MGTRVASSFSVDLGPRADADPLAREIRRRVLTKLERGEGLGAFRRMWGTVVLVAVRDDSAGGTTHTTLTLRFDWGRLMIHEGRVGRPDVTLWGTPESILGLGSWGRLPAWVGRFWFPDLPEESASPSDLAAVDRPGDVGAPRPAPSSADAAVSPFRTWFGKLFRATGNASSPVQSSWSPLSIDLRRSWPRRRPHSGGLKIYGGARHPRFVWRLARLLANPG